MRKRDIELKSLVEQFEQAVQATDKEVAELLENEFFGAIEEQQFNEGII